jgi:hypothetical protein
VHTAVVKLGKDIDGQKHLGSQCTRSSQAIGCVAKDSSSANSAEEIAQPTNWSQAGDTRSSVESIPEAKPLNQATTKGRQEKDMKRQKQNRLRKVIKNRRSPRPVRRKPVAPRTADELFAKPKRSQEAWIRATQVVTRIRTRHETLQKASREEGIAPQTVIRLAGAALRKRSSGRYAAKASDRLLRVLVIPTNKGSGEIAVRDSRQATQLSEHWIAVHRYLQTGDASSIDKFRGKKITDAKGKKVPLVTDLDELNRLGSAGAFSFESLYAKAS